jgi:hypothetical protein
VSWAWWYTTVIPALRRIVSSKSAWATWTDPILTPSKNAQRVTVTNLVHLDIFLCMYL